ncbi:MAG: type II toxin-antitoxin system VapC family toxin [Deltaproteobacteria bacterium]|nr:type II toxin-antitoxin system VapC family toxin [Deltaproteobacteria bacterium]
MGALTLPSAGPIYLDANGFIYSVERIEPYRTMLEPMWLLAQAGRFEIVSSKLVILETLVKPLREKDTLLENLFRALLFAREVRLLPATASLWEQAAQLRATTGLKTPDALHAATALVVGSTLFVTNDGGFRRVSGLPVSILDEVAKQEL